ncbi:hypothetical protein IMG5_116050 [Ichthyophthirius multifiliis]|uniref:DNA-PKcs N-terminal domain-containing protein n=1 Tax=Ichthyophthirius multifiliis TaxID=5932 RepID=G0QUA7_ICHMU|nr:hypothetical protein IMG5_116050 [Ichthyophthirius multifiliis]EGR31179.1 hypothetical protein IMG5_116050 [Ichthyophthirius multifiliis]|eukprot:XP_004034665.1 hypothetical protein IMG5_116050 [Ichthyophthirius multifiliis]
MFEDQLQSALIKLQLGNFSDSKQIIDELENLLFDNNLNYAQISLCNAKIFNSTESIFLFLEQYAQIKDNLLANVRKGLYQLLAQYIKKRRTRIQEYIQLIFKNCIQLFKKEESAAAKEGSLLPIIKLLKYIDQKDYIRDIIIPQNTLKILLEEIKFCKPSQKVKGAIWHLTGLIFEQFKTEIKIDTKIEIQTICLIELSHQIKESSKPEIGAVIGMLKSLRHSLVECHLSREDLGKLYQLIKVCIVPIVDVKNYGIIKSSLKVLQKHTQLIKKYLLEEPVHMFEQLVKLIQHTNKGVRFSASDALDSVMILLSDALDNQFQGHQQAFNYIIQKIYSIITGEQQQQGDQVAFSMIIVVRIVGVFAKAISKHMGQQQLGIFFNQMITISEKKVLKYLKQEEESLLEKEQGDEDEEKKIMEKLSEVFCIDRNNQYLLLTHLQIQLNKLKL